MSTTDLAWFKSSYSGSSGDNCVEVAVSTEGVLVRDSKDTERRGLSISRQAWSAFTKLAGGGQAS
ncbi:DUF397 domain-containing protein [Streptomyces sp. SM10]|uniref:DUF397 domain-containing protein n=1 Tax=Streptomyces sp. SM10 TaxID=565556 RepID=UPI000CD4C5DD|nr:DUF397 domain-containing protein [Streptomyces sp. SM10]